MWRVLYNIGLLIATPIVVGLLLAKPRCRRGFLQRMGWQAHPSDKEQRDRPVVWVHAVSLGEAVAAAPLVKALRERHPELCYIVTTVTETGREAVEQRLAGVAEHRYAPLDFPWAVSGMVNRLRPSLYLFVETELWPNVLWTLNDRRIPTILVNGRLSSRSFDRQNRGAVRSFYRSVIRSITLCLMQADRDRQRIVALGADPSRVHTTGNIKFDQPLPAGEDGEASERRFGLNQSDRLILAGSTHAGEEEMLVAAYRRIVEADPSVVLMLAPRHIERVERVESMIRDAGFTVQRKSRIEQKGRGPRVVILDTRGELARAYREATVAFVGGTLVPVGGHNLLEPAAWGKPVLFGPYTDHCAEVATMLEEAGGGRRVRDVEELVRVCGEWLADPHARERVGGAARRVVSDNQGALQRTLDLIESCFNAIETSHRSLRPS
ncbi:3-deoxy-D-manno-octulosonic acid transferase [Candidatus Nitrospira inopinata]|jgi:3-deoxy-D-manno-octulosonic-acid transferase|nr:3-deoxy-D-manno-octulosonic acid transferase [Candidatus Nitrospira inopinata]